MRILHLSSLYPPFIVGGAEKVVATLATTQAKCGLDIFVTHLAPHRLDECERDGATVMPLHARNPLWIAESAGYPGPVRVINKLVTVVNIWTIRAFQALLDAVRPDIVHSHSMVELPPMLWAIAARRGIAVVHTLHDYDLLCVRGSLFKDGHRCHERHMGCIAVSAVKRRYHSHIGAVVAISEPVMDTHLAAGLFANLPDRRRHVIWNPVDLPGDEDDGGAPRPANDDRVMTFGFLGRLVAEKGIEILLQACHLLPQRGWRLKVAGAKGPDHAKLEYLAKGLPVEFCGFVDSREFLRGIDVLIVPSVWAEPFGLTVIEAFAAGIPVIGSNSGGLTDLVAAIGEDWLVPAGDARALAERMTQAINSRRSGLPDTRVYSDVLKRVHPTSVVQKYQSVYESLLAG